MIEKIKVALALAEKAFAVGEILTAAGKALVALFEENKD